MSSSDNSSITPNPLLNEARSDEAEIEIEMGCPQASSSSETSEEIKTSASITSIIEARQSRSPFMKVDEEPRSWVETTLTAMFVAFVNHIPHSGIKKMSVRGIIMFGSIAYCISFGMFFAFFITGYMQSRKEEFVSLSKDSGQCNEVKKSVTGFFVGDSNGKWTGDVDFKYVLGAYEFDFTSLKVDSKEFAAEMKKLQQNELTRMGSMQEKLGINYNLLIWMHFSSYFTVNDKVQSFGFTVEPGDVFDREWMWVFLFRDGVYCSQMPSVTFEPTYGHVSVVYSYSDYMASECPEFVYPSSLGYDPSYDHDSFTIDVDLVSLTSCLAVNLEILPKSHLQVIGQPDSMDIYNGQSLYLQRYYDPRYPRMESLFCFQLQDDLDDYYYWTFPDDLYGPTLFDGKCVLMINSMLLIPAFFPYWPECQSCNDTDMSLCNDFDLVAAYIYFEDDNLEQTIDLLNKYEDSKALNDAVSSSFYADGTSFCNNSCTLIAVNAYDYFDHFSSPYFYDLNNAHCTDSTMKESFDMLGETPPTDLVEEYYRCKHSVTSSLLRSVGIAYSNTLLFSPAVLMLFFLLVVFYYSYVKKEPYKNEEYSDAQIEKALKVLASKLMSIAHGKETSGESRVIAQLAKDLNELGAEEALKKSL